MERELLERGLGLWLARSLLGYLKAGGQKELVKALWSSVLDEE